MTISTYLGYVTATKDMTSTLARVASQATVKSDQEYYDANINKVKNVDDFMDNYRLYSYAMKAYGLEDMTYAKAMMKKVLESDLSDSSSFANSLTDTKYKTFAAAFNFGVPTPTTTTNSSGLKVTTTSSGNTAQSTTQQDDTIGLYEQSFTTEADDAKTETAYYDAAIDKVTTTNDIVGNSRLKNYILQAAGIDPTYISNTYLKQVLTSDVNDPDSFVNQSGSAAFKKIAAEFSFNADGTISGTTAQTADQKAAVESAYNGTVPSYTTYVGAKDNDAYYKTEIANATSVSDLTSDTRVFDYIKTAYGLDSDLSAFEFNTAFTNSSFASAYGLTDVVAKFNFQSDGTVASGETAQSSDEISDISTDYMANYQTAHSKDVKESEANYKTKMAAVKTISDFFAGNTTDSDTANDDVAPAYQVALRAYGISTGEVSNAELKKILESDPYDPTSYVSKLKDSRFTALAKAFNFDSSGNLRAPVQAISTTTMNSYISKYAADATLGLTGEEATAATATAKTDGTYFATNIVKVTSVTDLLADKKLTNFILKANGIDPTKVTTATLKKAFASDPSDSDSFVNTADGAQFKSIVEDFNFGTDGELTSSKLGTVQNEGARLATDDLYLHQTLEEQQGDNNQGVRLALYFQRKAPDINSIYDIMSDTALYSVITTTFSLPSSISNMDVADQAAMLQKFVTVSDLHDPTKLDHLLQRFAAVYDTTNNTAANSSPALSILSGSSSVGISADTLLSIAQLKTS